MSKHKKLKRKYQTLQNDLYVDEDDLSGPTMREDHVDQKGVSDESNKDLNTTKLQDTKSISIQPQSLKRNWRSQVKYI